jgi:hypothetical protein
MPSRPLRYLVDQSAPTGPTTLILSVPSPRRYVTLNAFADRLKPENFNCCSLLLQLLQLLALESAYLTFIGVR